MGRTRKSVELQSANQLIETPKPEPAGERETYWKKRALTAEKDLAKSSEARTATDVLVENVLSAAPISYMAAPAIAPRAKRGTSSPQSAVLLFSDQHVGCVVTPEQTQGFGGYNFDIFLRRLKRLENSVVSILHDHVTTNISELVIPMLGDTIDGALQHAAECGQDNTLFSQFFGASHAIAQFVRNLSAHVPRVRVVTCVGNHTRWGTQRKMPTKNRFSNLDHFIYAQVKALTRDIPTIDFQMDQQPSAEFKVQGFNFLALHGDTLRGGDRALGIPAHALGRNISASSQMRLKFERPGINYYLLGHFHRPLEICHALGDAVFNGGFPGIDGYAMAESFTPCDPVQKMFFMHPRHGRTASYILNLKYADLTGPTPYEMPGGFPVI